MTKTKKTTKKDKKQADILNHRRQLWWLANGIVMIPTLHDEILMRKAIMAKQNAKAST